MRRIEEAGRIEQAGRGLTAGFSRHGPLDEVGSEDGLLYAAALHQVVGEHAGAQAVLVAGHKHQLEGRQGLVFTYPVFTPTSSSGGFEIITRT